MSYIHLSLLVKMLHIALQLALLTLEVIELFYSFFRAILIHHMDLL